MTFNHDEELFLNVEQIIPTPEAKELMIGMSAKEAEEKETEVVLKNRHKLRLSFWEQTLEGMHNSSCDLFKNINPSKDHWLSAGSGVRACPYSMIFGTKEARVELWLSRSQLEENKFMFDWLLKHKEEIEQNVGFELEWFRLDDKKSCRIQISKDFDGYNKDNWTEMSSWIVDNMIRLEKGFKKPLVELNKELRQRAAVQDSQE